MFYLFAQNNSGGYFVHDDIFGITEDVFIEDESFDSAVEKIEKIGEEIEGFYDWCECCGERWEFEEKYTETFKNLEEVKKRMTTRFSIKEEYFVHFSDGRFEKFKQTKITYK